MRHSDSLDEIAPIEESIEDTKDLIDAFEHEETKVSKELVETFMDKEWTKSFPKTKSGVNFSKSPHWKRIDVRKKRITRGLSFLVKDFIKEWLKSNKNIKNNFFYYLDGLLKKQFPDIYKEKRIQAFGGIGKIVLL